jgi:hypothetical protein
MFCLIIRSLIPFVCFSNHRINKRGSQKDAEQKKNGNYFFYEDDEDDDDDFDDI